MLRAIAAALLLTPFAFATPSRAEPYSVEYEFSISGTANVFDLSTGTETHKPTTITGFLGFESFGDYVPADDYRIVSITNLPSGFTAPLRLELATGQYDDNGIPSFRTLEVGSFSAFFQDFYSYGYPPFDPLQIELSSAAANFYLINGDMEFDLSNAPVAVTTLYDTFPVPEPRSVAVLAVGVISVGLLRRRRTASL